MRKPATIAMYAVIAVLAVAVAVLYQKYQVTAASYADVKVAEETSRTHYAEAFNAIAEIQDSLNAITTADGAVQLKQDDLRTEQRLSQPSRAEALESIALLNASIQRTKTKISELESSLEKSGTKAAGLQRMIHNLKRTVVEKQEHIAVLTGQVDSLQTQVAGLATTVQGLETTVAMDQQNIEEKRRELGTIYYIIGTKKELSSSGVIVAKGGVLGLGKTLKLSGQFDNGQFTTLDTDMETVVRAPATRVEVLSPQPLSSYEVKIENGQVELRILDPKEFRKVKHLVIMTA